MNSEYILYNIPINTTVIFLEIILYDFFYLFKNNIIMDHTQLLHGVVPKFYGFNVIAHILVHLWNLIYNA